MDTTPPSNAAARKTFYDAISQHSMSPLWEVLHALVPNTPKTPPGDFIITPSWTWHDHGHLGVASQDAPVVWLDGLDIPMLKFFDAGFAENDTSASQTVTKPEGISSHRYGANMLPVRHVATYGSTSPIFSYPYDRTREALHKLEMHSDIDAWDGVKLRYANPATGGSPMPTMATFMQRLPAGFEGKPYRQTDGAVFSVVAGHGSISIEHNGASVVYQFSPRDHFVIPSWHTAQLHSQSGCVLFSFSDRPVHQALGIHREERLS